MNMKQQILKATLVLGFTCLFLVVYLSRRAISQDDATHTTPPPTPTTTTTSLDQRNANRDSLLFHSTPDANKVTSTNPSQTSPASTNAPAAAESEEDKTSQANDTSDTALDPDLKEMLRASQDELHLVPLSLSQAIMAGLKTNFDILIKMQNQKAADAAVREAQGDFDPVLNITGSYEHESLPQNTEDFVATGGTPADILDNLPRVFQERNYHYKIALDAKTPIGTQLEAKTQLDDLQNTLDETSPLSLFSPEYQSYTGLSITQPLLRNFGTDVNESGIRVAVLDKFVSLYEVQDEIISTISQIEQNYDQLTFLDEEITAKGQDKELGVKIVNERIKSLERGESSPREVNRSESALAEIIEDYTKVQNDILNRQAQLQALICSHPPDRFDFRYLPSEPLRERSDADLDYNSLMNLALLNRPKYLEAKVKVDQQNLRLVYAKNKLWPELDFTSTLGENGLSGSYGNSYYRQVVQQGPQWSVGFIFSVPFGNDDAEGKYGEVVAQKKEALLALSQVELNTSLEIQKLIQIIRTNRGRLQAMRLFVKTASQAYENEKIRLEKGLSTDLDVLRYQRDLSEARARESAVLADLNNSYVQLEEVTGQLLIDNKIVLKQ
jgi:outer membrane protein